MNTLYLYACFFAAGYGSARGWFEAPVLLSRRRRIGETVLASIVWFIGWPVGVLACFVNLIDHDTYYGDNQ